MFSNYLDALLAKHKIPEAIPEIFVIRLENDTLNEDIKDRIYR